MYQRKAVVAGSFYPSNPDQLSNDIEKYLLKAEQKEISGELVGLISPHAGYVYSGPVAAYSYNQIKSSGIELAVVLAPSHRARFGGASVIPSGEYGTPLGSVEIDSKIGEALLNERHFKFIDEVHSSEHSLEVQVPFLQKVLSNFKLVPIIIGTTDLSACREIADELLGILKDEQRKFVLVISTDLSHYHSYGSAKEIDKVYINSLLSLDEKIVNDAVMTRKAEACGHGPVLTGLVICKKLGANKVDVLQYATSGDTAGGRGEVVGYLSAAITKQ